MRLFDVATVLSVTTGRLLCEMDGIYEILNFMTGDTLYTHQLPRASRECEPSMLAQYPTLMESDSQMKVWLENLDSEMKEAGDNRERRSQIAAEWVEGVRLMRGLPEQIPVHALAEGVHARINPIEEAHAMMGGHNVIAVQVKP